MTVLLAFLLNSGAAVAAEADQAEALRLEESMRSLTERNAFKGVDRQYQQLLELEAELTSQAHRMGADAARALGDGFERRARLARAQAAGDSEAEAELYQLSQSWGSTYLVGSPDLMLDPALFAGDQRAALELANDQLSRDGRFYGLLPAGSYTWAQGDDWAASFTLEPGAAPLARVGDQARPLSDAYAPIVRIDEGYRWNELTLDTQQMVSVVDSHPDGARVLARARTSRTLGIILALTGLGGLVTGAALPDSGKAGVANSVLFGIPGVVALGGGIPLFIHGLSGRKRALRRYNKSVTSAVPDAGATR